MKDKRKFYYLPKGVQSEVERVKSTYGLPNDSAAARVMLRYAAKVIRDAQSMNLEEATGLLAFIERELEIAKPRVTD